MKKMILKASVLILVFIATVATYFIVTMPEKEEDIEMMKTATLPVVSIMYNEDNINTLHGYTVVMNGKYMRNSITPISDDRTVTLNIDLYSNVIAGISYELRSVDTERLIEKKSLNEYEINDGNITENIKLSGMIEKNTEYLLNMQITTEKHGEINYYTRVIWQDEADILSHIAYIKDFSVSTLDKEVMKKYKSNLEPDKSADNTNLAKVNLYSSFENVTWGELQVERVTEPMITIKELLGDTGCYELNYKVKALSQNGIMQYYNVREFFRVRKSGDKTYLYVYERSMNEIFNGTNSSVSATRINLGLDSDLYIESCKNATGSFVAFVKERNLWLMDMNKNRIINLMSFESGSDDDIRDLFDENSIEIVSTHMNGDVLFLVYGYMNKGEHEGKVGVALYQYKYATNEVSELVFVTTDKPYQILKGQIGKFAYVTEEGNIYLLVEDNIYTITTDSNEYVQIADNLQKGNFIINAENNVIAWHENGSLYEADSIRVIDVAAKKDYVIKASEDDYIKVIGFIGNDMVYGVANKADIYDDELGNTVFPMYKIMVNIYDEEKNDIEYQKENVYVHDTEIKDNMLVLKRASKTEDGLWDEISDDQLINKSSNVSTEAKLSTITTDLKLKELVMKFEYTVTSTNRLATIEPQEILFTQANDMVRENNKDDIHNYYVYANGGILLETKSIIQAIGLANENYGVVVDNNGNTIWARLTKLSNKAVPNATLAASPNYSSINSVLADNSIECIDVSTISLDAMLNFSTKEIPVLVNLPEWGIVSISGYSGYGGRVDTIYFRAYDGENFKMSVSAAEKQIVEGGNRAVAVLKIN